MDNTNKPLCYCISKCKYASCSHSAKYFSKAKRQPSSRKTAWLSFLLCTWRSYAKLIPDPRNEELIEKVTQAQGNSEAIESLWDNEGYSPSAVLDSLFYAGNDERITLNIREDHLEQWLYDELYDWFPEHLNDWLKDKYR